MHTMLGTRDMVNKTKKVPKLKKHVSREADVNQTEITNVIKQVKWKVRAQALEPNSLSENLALLLRASS